MVFKNRTMLLASFVSLLLCLTKISGLTHDTTAVLTVNCHLKTLVWSTTKRFPFDKIITTFTSLSSESLLAIFTVFQVKIIITCNVQVIAGFPRSNYSSCTVLSRFYHVVNFRNCATFPGSKKTLTSVKSVDVKIVPKLSFFLIIFSRYLSYRCRSKLRRLILFSFLVGFSHIVLRRFTFRKGVYTLTWTLIHQTLVWLLKAGFLHG